MLILVAGLIATTLVTGCEPSPGPRSGAKTVSSAPPSNPSADLNPPTAEPPTELPATPQPQPSIVVSPSPTAVSTSLPPSQAPPTPTPRILCSGAATIRGTYLFDFETCHDGVAGDVWWEQVDSVNRLLVPQGGAAAAVLGRPGLDAVSAAQLMSLSYGSGAINGSNTASNQLTAGTVVAIKTRAGHYAKMRIDSYGYNLAVTVTTYG
jgi:hypothetical protein